MYPSSIFSDPLADVSDFGLSQILPLNEDDDRSTSQPKIISASFTDPHVLVLRDDFSAIVLTTDERGEIDDTIKQVEGSWLSGSLYEDSNDILRLDYPEESDEDAGNVLMFLLSTAGGLQVRPDSARLPRDVRGF